MVEEEAMLSQIKPQPVRDGDGGEAVVCSQELDSLTHSAALTTRAEM